MGLIKIGQSASGAEQLVGPGKGPEVPKRRSKKLFNERMEELQELGLPCDPIRILMEIAVGKELNDKGQLVPMFGGLDRQGNSIPVDAKTRMEAAAELCAYLYPKRKAVEISGPEGEPITFIVSPDLSALPHERTTELASNREPQLELESASDPDPMILPPLPEAESDS